MSQNKTGMTSLGTPSLREVGVTAYHLRHGWFKRCRPIRNLHAIASAIVGK